MSLTTVIIACLVKGLRKDSGRLSSACSNINCQLPLRQLRKAKDFGVQRLQCHTYTQLQWGKVARNPSNSNKCCNNSTRLGV